MRSFDAVFAFASACSLVLGLGCAGIQPIHQPPTLAEIREINAEGSISIELLPTAGRDHHRLKIDHVVSADAEKIVVAPSHGPPLAFQLGDVAQFHLRRRGRGAVIGAGVGAGIGALSGLGIASFLYATGQSPDSSGFPVGSAIKLAEGGAVACALIGAVIGAFGVSHEDFPLLLGPAPPSQYGSPKLALAPPAAKTAAIVVAPTAEVRSAPFKVAPVLVTLARGQRLYVDLTPNAGWRVAFLSDGRVGYIQDAQIEADSP
jgi:hypothetical protein